MRGEQDRLRTCPTCGGEPPEGLRDYAGWSFDILPEKVGFTDIDAILERNGQFLVLEFKPPGKGTWVPQGQWLTFQRMLASGLFAVWVISPTPGDPNLLEVHFMEDRARVKATRAALKVAIERWWEAA
jgi:hypothetical protein